MSCKRFCISLLFIIQIINTAVAQEAPSSGDNIQCLVTFGKEASTAWGDDDFTQIFFIIIPKDNKAPFYIRIFDPETSGKFDEQKGGFDTEVNYSVYGGKDAYSNAAARSVSPLSAGNFKSGTLLTSKLFGNTSLYEEKWYSMGPFNPKEGELQSDGTTVFKIIAEGVKGDDGNGYKYFFSTSGTSNIPIEGANAFTYKYKFRLIPKSGTIAHFYPYVDKDLVKNKVYNFDFDKDGIIQTYSVAKNGLKLSVSNNDEWVNSTQDIVDKEKNTSLDVQIIKKTNSINDMALYMLNQYNEAIAFFSVPIGGKPKFDYNVNIEYHIKKK